ncbi:FtsX-like permease family protein [Kitasatospora sp. NPDC056651]|uniref:FtsX-like permease family protein n=1 Tax=Kitasatospora sp. NPDC056651 TaxID=3345892 RepID=UPI0036820225
MARQRVASQQFSGPDALANPLSERLGQTMLVITVMIGVLASINAVFIVWATVLDARRSSAVARALGADAGQVSASLVYAQAIPVTVGALLGIPGGMALFTGVGKGGPAHLPSPVVLPAVVVGTIALISLLTSFPARAGARRPVAEVLQAEAA